MHHQVCQMLIFAAMLIILWVHYQSVSIIIKQEDEAKGQEYGSKCISLYWSNGVLKGAALPAVDI